jgi:hypothetical protein
MDAAMLDLELNAVVVMEVRRLKSREEYLLAENNKTEEHRRQTARDLAVALATIRGLQEALFDRNNEIDRLKAIVKRTRISLHDEALAAKSGTELAQRQHILRPASEYHDDLGSVLWFHLPIEEPPMVGYGPGSGEANADGTSTACARLLDKGWLTHFALLPDCRFLRASDGAAVAL